MVLPAQGKPFEAFQADDAVCRQSAAQLVEGSQEFRIPDGDALIKGQTNECEQAFVGRREERRER
jgi:hypothetical protein